MSIESLKEKLLGGQEKFKKYQTELQTILNNRQTLLTQLNENNSVLAELKELVDDDEIYKLVGPVMIKQSRSDALSNIEKRVEFITEEISRANELMKNVETSMNNVGSEMQSAQSELKALLEAEAAAAQNASQ
eukprot:GDKJ01005336.1.p1 GENE.GDKJ01005336.1~~GDKJ01005336.1.p1  ORF type:complete len:133 (+),score=41.80 GDKJ01005336.1:28-426(+)